MSYPIVSTENSSGELEAIILAGGFGTRLRSVVSEVPKCMAPVAGRPFLFYLINYLRSQGVTRFIFSLGYKHELVEAYLQTEFSTLRYSVVIENEPLGTGGAARLACTKATGHDVLLANGDTMFQVNVQALLALHRELLADCTLSLKPMQQIDRYGVVGMNGANEITSFFEKKYYESGLINGGLYALNVGAFLKAVFAEKFSFENDYLQKSVAETGKQQAVKLMGLIQENYFIDIGIPSDYEKAGKDFQSAKFEADDITREWTLFLDRDGVINEEKHESYVFTPDEFILYHGVREAFGRFGKKFGRIIVVTNQRGIGKGLMTEDDLHLIHAKLISMAKEQEAIIDAIYFCSNTDSQDPNRKPNPGMAFQAKKDFPGIDFNKSVMVGNNPGDMRFGRNAGMYTVFVKTTRPGQTFPDPDIDQVYNSLLDFAVSL